MHRAVQRSEVARVAARKGERKGRRRSNSKKTPSSRAGTISRRASSSAESAPKQHDVRGRRPGGITGSTTPSRSSAAPPSWSPATGPGPRTDSAAGCCSRSHVQPGRRPPHRTTARRPAAGARPVVVRRPAPARPPPRRCTARTGLAAAGRTSRRGHCRGAPHRRSLRPSLADGGDEDDVRVREAEERRLCARLECGGATNHGRVLGFFQGMPGSKEVRTLTKGMMRRVSSISCLVPPSSCSSLRDCAL